MSGTASTSVVTVGVGGGELGYGGYRAPFTPVQWQELEHQAMIYKYLVAGLPVPPDLVMPIRRSFDAISSRFFNHPSLGYCSYYGKKFDPEPGRCRRTDGKKWRCSKDAHPDSKYCERHMHRGRNRSRKPVESQTTTQSLSTAATNIATNATGGGNNTVSFQSGGSGSFQNMPLYSAVSTEGSSFGGSMMQMEPMLYGINSNREFSFSHGDSGNVESLGLGTGTGSSAWRLMPSQVSSTSLLDQKSDSRLLGHSSSQQHVAIVDKQQHCFFGSEIGSPGSLKRQEQHAVHPFFSEWPSTKESWSNLEDDGSNKNIFSSTQLSISTPRASSDFPSRSAYSPNDG